MKIRTLYIIILGVILFSFLLVIISSFSNIYIRTGLQKDDQFKTIIIDAGHGGEDGGAEVSGVLEKDINLSISLILADILKCEGYRVKTVRDTDISVYSEGMKSLSQKKTSDLKNRVEMFNLGDNIVVSVHQNKFTDSRYSGAQVFCSPNNEESERLGERVRNAVVSLTQPDNKRELKFGGKDIYILDKATAPAIIVECGFMSNPNELVKLCDEDYRKQLAFAIAAGISEYCYQYDKEL